jgi:hypothetical protein
VIREKKLGEVLNVEVCEKNNHIWLEQGGARLLVILDSESRSQFCDELRAILVPTPAAPAAAAPSNRPTGCTVRLPSGQEVNHPIATVFDTGDNGHLYLTDNDTDCGLVALYAAGQWVSVVGHGDYVDPDGGDR